MTLERRAMGPAVAAVVLTAACANGEVGTVEDTARRFYAAVQDEDGAQACALLAPETRSEVEQSAGEPCDEAILQEDIPSPGPRSTSRVFGTMAQVKYAGETAFLARFDGAWKVMAAACTKPAQQPYDCQVKGR